jgi:hypothetical protein
MTTNIKYVGILAIALAVTVAPVFAESAFAANTNTKARVFQNAVQVTEDNPGQILTDTECVGSIDDDAGATKMICYLIPPGVSNNDNSNAVASLESNTAIDCPTGAGFGANQDCYSVTFDGSLFDQQGDWHVHVEFYNAQNQLIADGRQTFQNHSFFVLPESPIGVIALLGSTLAVLGGFMFLRSRNHSSLPM